MASAAWIGLAPAPAVRAEEIDEEKALKVQAAYLFNFAKFIEWPDEAFEDKHAPFVIGILGDDPFGKILDDTIKDKQIAHRPVQVRRFRQGEPMAEGEPGNCHILFIANSERHRLKQVLAEWTDQPVLLVAGIPDFAREGGMIGFVLENQRIIFEINRDALDKAGLRASAGLLKLARIVEPATRQRDPLQRVGSGP